MAFFFQWWKKKKKNVEWSFLKEEPFWAEPPHIGHYREPPKTPLTASQGIRYGNLKIAH